MTHTPTCGSPTPCRVPPPHLPRRNPALLRGQRPSRPPDLIRFNYFPEHGSRAPSALSTAPARQDQRATGHPGPDPPPSGVPPSATGAVTKDPRSGSARTPKVPHPRRGRPQPSPPQPTTDQSTCRFVDKEIHSPLSHLATPAGARTDPHSPRTSQGTHGRSPSAGHPRRSPTSIWP